MPGFPANEPGEPCLHVSRNGTASVVVTLEPGNPPSVMIAPLATRKVNPSARLVLDGSDRIKLEWVQVRPPTATSTRSSPCRSTGSPP